MRTPSAFGTACFVDAARCSLRAWRMTLWPLSARSLAACKPIPSLEPVMKMRVILTAHLCIGVRKQQGGEDSIETILESFNPDLH
jgi:hypothetical protein